jgi:hypothetical protein
MRMGRWSKHEQEMGGKSHHLRASIRKGIRKAIPGTMNKIY